MDLSGIITFLMTILVIIGVVIFTYFATKWMGSKMGMQNRTENLKVLEKMFITPDKCILIVDIAGKIVVLGMSSQAIVKIDEIEDIGSLNLETGKIGASFGEFFKEKFDTVKRLEKEKEEKKGNADEENTKS